MPKRNPAVVSANKRTARARRIEAKVAKLQRRNDALDAKVDAENTATLERYGYAVKPGLLQFYRERPWVSVEDDMDELLQEQRDFASEALKELKIPAREYDALFNHLDNLALSEYLQWYRFLNNASRETLLQSASDLLEDNQPEEYDRDDRDWDMQNMGHYEAYGPDLVYPEY